MLTGLWLAASLSGVLDLSDRTEFRVRDPGDVTNTIALDLETAPDAKFTVSSRRARFTVSYVPRLTLWDMNVDLEAPVLLQGGSARAEWHNRFEQWWIDEEAAYGGTNLTALSYGTTNAGTGGNPPRVDAVPVSRVIEYESSQTTLGTRVQMRKWTFEWDLGYELSGGAGVEDQAVLPRQFGPLAGAKLEYAATRRSHFITAATGEESSFSTGAQSTLVEGEERWHYALRRSTMLELAAGAAEARVRPVEQFPYTHLTYPVAEAAIGQSYASALQDRWVARLGVRVEPVINRLFGTVDERAEATLRGTWTRRRTQVNADLTAQETVESPDQNGVELIYGEASVAMPTNASGTVAFDIGTRCTAQRLNTPLAPGSSQFTQASFVQGILFIGVTFRARPMRL